MAEQDAIESSNKNQNELFSAFQSGLSQSLSLMDKMSDVQKHAAAKALQGLLEKTPIGDGMHENSKRKERNGKVILVDGKKYKKPQRGRPRNRNKFIKAEKDDTHLSDLDKSDSEEVQYKNSGIKGGACDICGRYFTQQGNMRRHRMRHTGERPYKCKFCYASFIEKKSRDAHYDRKHAFEPQAHPMCSVCGVEFETKKDADNHSCSNKPTIRQSNDIITLQDDGRTNDDTSKTSFVVPIKRKRRFKPNPRYNDFENTSKNNRTVKTLSGESNISQQTLNEIKTEIRIFEKEHVDTQETEGDDETVQWLLLDENGLEVDAENLEQDSLQGEETDKKIYYRDSAHNLISAVAKKHLVSTAESVEYTEEETENPSSDGQTNTGEDFAEDTESPENPENTSEGLAQDKVTSEWIKDDSNNQEGIPTVFVLTDDKQIANLQKPCKTSNGWMCSECNFSTKEFQTLMTHLRSHAESLGALQCDDCGASMSSLTRLQRHSITTHGVGFYRCCSCPKRFGNYSTYERHIQDCIAGISSRYQCSECGKNYSSMLTLRAHVEGKHSEKKFRCSHCNRSFNFASNLLRHVKLHTGDKPHRCDICGLGFIEKKCFITHMLRKHSEGGMIGGVLCQVCGKGFGSQPQLKNHMRVHKKDEVYACSICNQTYSSKANMKRHELTHTGEKPFQCSECGKCFTEKKSVNIHMRQHTGERPYKCPYCEKSFTQNTSLEAHLPVHTRERKFLCTICGAAFLRQTNLSQHTRKHMGPPDKNCSYCNSTFYTRTDLKRHLLTHSESRPLQCSVCQESFSKAADLRDHVNSHTEQNTPHACLHCDAQFSDALLLDKHRKLYHDEVAFEENPSQHGQSDDDQMVVEADAMEQNEGTITQASQHEIIQASIQNQVIQTSNNHAIQTSDNQLLDAATYNQVLQLAKHNQIGSLNDDASCANEHIVYLPEGHSLLAFTDETTDGTDVEFSIQPAGENSEYADNYIETSMDTEEVTFVQTGVESEIHAGTFVEGMDNFVEHSVEHTMDSTDSLSLQDVSIVQTGEHVIEIDGVHVDPSQVAYQEMPDKSGYYLIINSNNVS